MKILGISALYHDSAACIVIDGEIIAAASEERFTRKKHDFTFPYRAIEFCLKYAGLKGEDIDIAVYYDNPVYTLERYIDNVVSCKTDAKDLIESKFESMVGDKLWIHKTIQKTLSKKCEVYVCEHHVSHAASAFYPSPYDKAVILTVDGVGEWATLSIGVGIDNKIKLCEEIRYPHSLGLLYSAFTYFCGFKVNSGDYKFMGLAPYGKPIYEELICRELIDIKEDGSFKLNMKYFDFQYGRAMTNDAFADLFGGKRREPESRITEREMNIASSAQKVIEDILLKIVRHAKETYGRNIDNLVMAGGVALNCVANGKILDSQIFKNIWIQPAAGDAGGSLGVALYTYYDHFNMERKIGKMDSQKGSYLGPAYGCDTVEEFLREKSYPYKRYADDELFKTIAQEMADGKIIGCFHGRMEFGPRALGNRSIIADPTNEEMQARLNLKIKFRESFRPFAPSVLYEDVADYFELDRESPYMLLVEKVKDDRRMKQNIDQDLRENGGDMLSVVRKKRSDIPAITHVDYSARIQTVTEETNPYYYHIIEEFKKLTGYGVIVNTSFNVRGEPIVCSLQDAYECFMRTEMDILVMENCILKKEEQPPFDDLEDWRAKYELD